MINENNDKKNVVITCAVCKKELIIEEIYSKRKNEELIYYCNNCLEKINSALEEETKNSNIPLAIIASIIAGVIGGLIWYGISIFTGYQVGYLAIVLGWFIGISTSIGAGGKRGIKLQVISVLTTLTTLLISEFIIALYYTGKKYNISTMTLLNHLLENGYSLISVFTDVIKHNITLLQLIIWLLGLCTAYQTPAPRKFEDIISNNIDLK